MNDQLLKLFSGTTKDVVWYWNLVTNHLAWNENFQTLFGYPAKQMEPGIESWLAHIHPDDRERVLSGVSAAIDASQQFWSDEYRFIRHDGTLASILNCGYVIRDNDGSAVHMIGIMMDITERQRVVQEVLLVNQGLKSTIAERAKQLSDSEALYRTLTELAPQIIWLADPEGQVTYVNKAWCEMTGRTHDDSLGTAWASSMHPEDAPQLLAEWEHAYKHGHAYHGECRFRSKDSSYKTLFCVGAPVRNESGRIIYWVGINTDISEQKLAEQALSMANRELEAFSHSVSHDLRAPLRAIDGFSQALLEEYLDKLDAPAQHYLRRIRAGTQRMAQLIEDLLKLSRISRGELKRDRVDLSALAQRILDGLRQQEPQRQADFLIAEGVVAEGDTGLLEAALENLLANAWKFTGKRDKTQIEFGVRKNNGELAYFVQDNGVGFDMAYVDKLFGIFQRLHAMEEFPGTGIGLVTVQRIVRRHGGQIWAEATPSQGATFYFTL